MIHLRYNQYSISNTAVPTLPSRPLQPVKLGQHIGKSPNRLSGLLVRCNRIGQPEVSSTLTANGMRAIGVKSPSRRKQDLPSDRFRR